MAAARFGRVRFAWVRPPSAMKAAVEQLGEKIDAELQAGMAGMSERVESYMKQNAPWQNRTGAARAGLSSNSNVTAAHAVTLSAFHTVPYGGYLETGTSYNPWTGLPNQPYPILAPALQAHYAEVRKLMEKVARFQ